NPPYRSNTWWHCNLKIRLRPMTRNMHSRDRMPVPEADVFSSPVPSREFGVEQPELGLSGQATALDDSVLGEVGIRRQHGPVLGDLHWNGPIESAD
ncbi:unnamed protein product, partial [Mycena citricolor]